MHILYPVFFPNKVKATTASCVLPIVSMITENSVNMTTCQYDLEKAPLINVEHHHVTASTKLSKHNLHDQREWKQLTV